MDLKHCFGVDACKQLERGGPYDMIAIDGPVLPFGADKQRFRNVERLFCKGLFQRRCKPGLSHVRGTGTRLREEAGKAADILSDTTRKSQMTSSFPRVREGAVIEAFPNAFLGVCLEDEVYATKPRLPRRKKFGWLYEQWKTKRLIRRLPGLTSAERRSFQDTFDRTDHREHRAALICILSALLTARNHFTAVGDVQGGWFFLPPWQCWKRWAQDAIAVGIRELNDAGSQVKLIRCGPPRNERR